VTVMSETFAWVFPGGRLQREIQDVTVTNNTTKTIYVTVPAGKLWLLLGVRMVNPDDVARALSLQVRDSDDNLICVLATKNTSSNQALQWPNTASSDNEKRNPTFQLLKGGDKLRCNWPAGGASSGGTASPGLIVEYLELEQ